jgi:hypothetical protein
VVLSCIRLKERDHLEDLGTDGRIILNCTLKKQDGGRKWINLAQDKEKWLIAVNMVRYLLFP